MKAKFISFFLFMLAMSFFAACGSDDDPASDPEPEPGTDPVESVNVYTYKDKTVQVKSVSCFEQEGLMYVCMSPLQSLETLEDFVNSGKEYVMLGLDKSLVGNPITVGASEEDIYTLYYMSADGEPIVTVDPDGWNEVLTQGKITVTMTPGENETSIVKATFDFTLKAGGKFTGEVNGTYRAAAKLPCEFSFGGEVRQLKSAVVWTYEDIPYIYLSPDAGVTTVEDMSNTEFLMIAITPAMMGREIDIVSEENSYRFYNATDLGSDDLEEIDPDYWSESCSAGKFKVEKTDNNLKITFSFTLISGKTFEGSYEGAYTDIKQSTTNILKLDDKTDNINAAYYDKKDNGVALFLTPAAVTSAAELVDSKYYIRLFVPTEGLDGREVDITDTDLAFEFGYYSPANAEEVEIAKNNTGDAAGTFSVSKVADDKYEVTLNLKYLGEDSHKLAGNYSGTFEVYDTTLPNEYKLGEDNDPVTIQSVVVDKKSETGICVVYLSKQVGITTVADMSAADVVLRLPDGMINNRKPNGFSGDDDNAKISVTYDDVTYNRESIASGDLANGGNVMLSLDENEAEISFTVFSIKKYGSVTLSGYYKGAVTVVE